MRRTVRSFCSLHLSGSLSTAVKEVIHCDYSYNDCLPSYRVQITNFLGSARRESDELIPCSANGSSRRRDICQPGDKPFSFSRRSTAVQEPFASRLTTYGT